jgi:hypothetical protein
MDSYPTHEYFLSISDKEHAVIYRNYRLYNIDKTGGGGGRGGPGYFLIYLGGE